MSNCLVCELPLVSPPDKRDYGNRVSIDCPRCGRFTLAGMALPLLCSDGIEEDDRKKLSAWLRNNAGAVVESEAAIIEAIRNFPDYPVSKVQLLLLRELERTTEYPGAPAEFEPDCDFPTIWALRGQEARFHLDELERRGFIARKPQGRWQRWSITTEGWERLDDHAMPNEANAQVFVAMSFATALRPLFDDGIKPALERAGYRALRVDSVQHICKIDDRIEREIRDSLFLVADFTEQKQGVYYEAGLARGRGLAVIWSVREDEIAKVHFDTRQYNHLVWSKPSDLKEKLYDRVVAVIGKRKR